MKKHFTKLIVALLALAMLLPIVVQAAPTDGWTDEAEQAYQTLTEKAIQQVTESRDYLSLPIQQRNTRAVYALWTAGAVVPEGFYDAYLQSLAGWLDMAAQNGRCAYIPTAIRTVAAMGLDVTDFAGHDLLDPLRKPDMMTADEDRLNMLLDLSCAGEAGETKEFAALREQLLTEAMARQQSSGQFRYSTIPGTELRFTSAYDGNALFIWLRDKGVIKDPDRFEYILLTAQSVQALAPYQDRKDVSAAIDKALNYLSAQQLPSGGFARFGEENVDAYYLEFDDDRSGDFAPLAEVSGDKKVVLGLITSKKPDLEDPDTIKARIQEAAQYIPLDRLCLSTQCGFASTQEGNKLTEDQQWAKIALVQSIAKDVWGE